MLSGLLGIGGGIVVVPALYFLFSASGFPAEDLMRVAIGTSLACTLFSTLLATWIHHKKKTVVWEILGKMSLGLLLGIGLGALLVRKISGSALQIIFSFFLCALSIWLFRSKKLHAAPFSLPSKQTLLISSVSIGTLANILGIGGGSLIVPLLIHWGLSIKKAVGTSAALSFSISLGGSLSYLLIGLGKIPGPATIGFIDLRAFFLIVPIALITAPYGARLAHQIHDHTLTRAFALLLLATGLWMLCSNF